MSKLPDPYKRHSAIEADGYVKASGQRSVSAQMQIEAQHHSGHHIHFGSKNKFGIFLRITRKAKPGEPPLDELAENSIDLSVEQARDLAAWILYEAAFVEQTNQNVKNI